MRTCIQVACLDKGHDQSFYSYNSNGNTSIVSIPRISAEKVFSINSSLNNSIDETIVYNFDNETKTNKFAYKSTKNVNSYAGYSLYIFFDCDDSNPFKKEYCIDYMDCYPQWIKDGLTTEDINRNLQNFKSWFQSNKTVNIKLAKEKKRILSVIIDKILEIKKKDSVISSIGLVSNELEAEDLHGILKCALKSLPISLANQYSFNTKAGRSIRGLDIYCTTLQERENYDSKNLIINLDQEDMCENYNFNNIYAEYLSMSSDFCSKLLENDIFDSLFDTEEIIDKLNSLVLSQVLNLKFLSLEDLTDVVLDDYIRTLDKAKENETSKKVGLTLASKIFFKSNFFYISKENKDYFFKKYLINSDVNFDEFIDEKCISQVFSAADNSEDIKKYFAFLLECLKKNIAFDIQKNIKSFLYDDFSDADITQSNKKMISVLADYLLEEFDKSESYLKIFSPNYDLIVLHNIIKSAFAVLPKEHRHLYQFEEVINEANAGFVLKKGKNADQPKDIPLLIDIDYSYKNSYAEYINLNYFDAISISKTLKDSVNAIDQLNILARIKLITHLYNKDILEESDLDNCQRLLSISKQNEQTRQLSINLAYKIFFSPNFYRICDNLKLRKFFNDCLDGIPSNLLSKIEYTEKMIMALSEDYPTVQTNKYFDFLMDYYSREKNKNLETLDESIATVLYCKFDSYSSSICDKFISWWNSMKAPKIRDYFSQYRCFGDSEFINKYIKNATFDVKMLILETFKNKPLKKEDYNYTDAWIIDIFQEQDFDKIDYFFQVYDLLLSNTTNSKELREFFCLKFGVYLEKKKNYLESFTDKTFNLESLNNEINKLSEIVAKLKFDTENNNYKIIMLKLNQKLSNEKRRDILFESNQRIRIFDSELPIAGTFKNPEEKRNRWLVLCSKERNDGKTGYKNNSGGKPIRFVISSLISYLIILVILWVLNALIIPYLRKYGLLTIFIKNEIACTSIFSIFLICGCFVFHLYYFVIACKHESYIRHTNVAFKSVVYYYLSVCLIFLMLLLSGLLLF